MDVRLTHETRGICLSALSGSAVTSGSYESGVLWLTNTQIVILDTIHLWCFAGAVTNNVRRQRAALIWLLSGFSTGWRLRGLLYPQLCLCWHQADCSSCFYRVCCRETVLVHGWWDADTEWDGAPVWCSFSPKLGNWLFKVLHNEFIISFVFKICCLEWGHKYTVCIQIDDCSEGKR